MRKLFKVVVAAVAVMALMAGTAVATHRFADVPDGEFYAAPSEWAADNGITLGCNAAGTLFCPAAPVTRGENITFAYRYDQNVVQPSLGYVGYARGGFVNNAAAETEHTVSMDFVAPADGLAIVTYLVAAGRDIDQSPTTGVTSALSAMRVNGNELGIEGWMSWGNITTNDNRTWEITAVVQVDEGVNVIVGRVYVDEVFYLYSHDLIVEFVPNGQMGVSPPASPPGTDSTNGQG